MNGGKRRPGFAKNGLGYTIIEVMIVLAVSGVMFIIAANFISDKQGKTAFTEGVNELASTLQDTIEGVTDGQYTDIDLHCSFTPPVAGSAGATTISTVAPHGQNGQATQGTNAPCVFLGKVLHFGQQDGQGHTPAQQYEVFSIAGGRVGADGKPLTELVDSAPTVINSLTSQETIPQRLDVKSIKVDDPASGPNSFGIGFIQGRGSKSSTGDTQNGAQNVSLYYVANLVENKNTADAAASITGTTLKPAHSIRLCMSDDTRSAYITLGANNNQLSVNVDMRGEIRC